MRYAATSMTTSSTMATWPTATGSPALRIAGRPPRNMGLTDAPAPSAQASMVGRVGGRVNLRGGGLQYGGEQHAAEQRSRRWGRRDHQLYARYDHRAKHDHQPACQP